MALPITETFLKVQQGYLDLITRSFERSMRLWTTPLAIPQIGGDSNVTRSWTASSPVVRPVPARREQSEEVIGVGEEILEVEKRVVKTNKTTVYRHVVEKPVTQDVLLESETVVVERRKPAVGEHGDLLSERTVEVFDTNQVPVVSKRIRLAEEVIVRREKTQRVETITETVRKDEVRVEQPIQLPAVVTNNPQSPETSVSDEANRASGRR